MCRCSGLHDIASNSKSNMHQNRHQSAYRGGVFCRLVAREAGCEWTKVSSEIRDHSGLRHVYELRPRKAYRTAGERAQAACFKFAERLAKVNLAKFGRAVLVALARGRISQPGYFLLPARLCSSRVATLESHTLGFSAAATSKSHIFSA